MDIGPAYAQCTCADSDVMYALKIVICSLYRLEVFQSETDLRPIFKRSIFQTFWKDDCCPIFLFLELETSDLHHRPSFDQFFDF